MGNRRFKRLLSCMLAFVLACLPMLSEWPAMQVNAAEGETTWKYVKAGTGNGNSHDYEDASKTPAAVLLNNAKMPVNGSVSAKIRFTNDKPAENARFGMFYTYQDTTHWLYIGYDNTTGWYYQYKNGSAESYPKLEFSPSAPVLEQNKEYAVTISLANEVLGVTVVEGTNEYKFTGSVPALKELAEAVNGQGRFGFRAGNLNDVPTEFMFRDVTCGDTTYESGWSFLLRGLGSVMENKVVKVYNVTGKVKKEDGTAAEGATVRLAGKTATADAQGTYAFTGIENGTYELAASMEGYEPMTKSVTVTDEDLTVEDIQLQLKQVSDYDTFIESQELKAAIDKSFPRVMEYEMKTGSAAGKKFLGQTNEINTIKINGVAVQPTLQGFDKKEDSAVYRLGIENSASKILLDMEVTVSVSENDLIWKITKIEKKDGCAKIGTIEVPNLNLITIEGTQSSAQFMGAVNSGSVDSTGDREITFASGGGFQPNNSGSYVYGFVSGNGLSAGLWSNSEARGDLRVTRNNGANSISLTSNLWYYEYGDADESATYEHTPVSELPCAKVCFAPDLNDDGTADWQDGAIAYRDIMNNPYGSEDVPELVNYRVVMNLGGEATNPFLMSADNIKKVYLATDGLKQAIMHKGYGNEGHDSANSEYGDIAEKLGGEAEFRKLIEIAHQYHTEVGIHVNAQEAYPEAQSFSDDIILGPGSTGWNWMDQAYVLNKLKDLGTGLRYKRILQLYDRINGTSLYANKWPGVAGQGGDKEVVADAATIERTVAQNIADGTNMDFIYLDVWYQDSWETRKIAQQFNSLGWRFSTEFGTTGEYDSTWQHWATDGAYGDKNSKGNNSQVMRFLRNHQKDSFVLNYPAFGGAADNPLLGHMYMNGFEGWGSNDNFDDYITNTFTENLPAKFLQHYLITKWVNYSGVGSDTSPSGNIEKEITLKSEDGSETVVVTRNPVQRQDNIIERTITLNNTEILRDGAYLLPWEDSDTKAEKLYHWNYDGGNTTWTLLDGWKNLSNVMVYELSDQGRSAGKSVAVSDGSITLEAKAKTAYVVLKGEEAPKTLKKGFGEDAKVADPAFHNYAGTGDGSLLDAEVWSGDITDASVRVKKAANGDQYLMIEDPAKNITLSTTISDLVPGQNYVAQIYVDNRSDKKASIEVNNGKKMVSNYTLRSIAENYIRADLHNRTAVAGSRMQIMLVPFTAADKTAVFTLKREAGEGYTHFDDIRVVPKSIYNYREDGTFVQDFESVVQGLYPFVMGSGQGVNDPSTHLSEYHAPYTQSGWGNALIDDVISGRWSLKQHDCYFREGLICRTIPQNFRFEAGKHYEVSFDYQSGATNGFYVVTGSGEGEAISEYLPLEKTTSGVAGQKSWTNHYTLYITGSEDGQSWFGFYNFPTNQGDSTFGDYNFVMDNLVIREVDTIPPSLSLENAMLTFDGVNGTQQIEATVTGAENPQITYASANTAIATVAPDGTVTPVAFGETIITVTVKAGDRLLVQTVDVVVDRGGKRNRTFKQAYANASQSGTGADKAVDGSSSSVWHTPWSGFAVGENNPAILTLELDEGPAFEHVRFQQRTDGGSNGIIKKYQFVWGTEFNESTHTVTGGASGSAVALSGAQLQNGAWIEVDTSGVNQDTVKYLQIRVLEGTTNDSNGPYAAMAEFEAYYNRNFSGTDPEEGAVDKSGLVAAIKELSNLNTFGLSAADQQKIYKAMEDANKVLSSANATAADVAAQITALGAVKTAMTSGKKAELETMIAQCETIDLSEFTADSVKVFQNALKAAKLAVEKETTSSFDINNALYTLEKAYNDLAGGTTPKPPIGDGDGDQEEDPALTQAKQSLDRALSSAASVKNAGQKNYTAESWQAFIAAYNAAEAGKNSKDPAQLLRLQQALARAQQGLKERTLKLQEYTDAKTGMKFRVTSIDKKTVKLTKAKDIKTVKIPNEVTLDGFKCTVTAVGSKAFSGCKKLKTVTIGSNVTSIEANAFFNCKKLTKVNVGKKLNKVHKKAFKKCQTKKISVKLPKNLKKNKKLKKQFTKAGIKKNKIK